MRLAWVLKTNGTLCCCAVVTGASNPHCDGGGVAENGAFARGSSCWEKAYLGPPKLGLVGISAARSEVATGGYVGSVAGGAVAPLGGDGGG